MSTRRASPFGFVSQKVTIRRRHRPAERFSRTPKMWSAQRPCQGKHGARGATALPTRIVADDIDVRAIRAAFGLPREKFAARFGLDPRTFQEWEQRRRRPDRASRVLLPVIEREPDAVERALATAGGAAARISRRCLRVCGLGDRNIAWMAGSTTTPS